MPKHLNIIRSVFFLAFALLVSGCVGTSQTTRYYALDTGAITKKVEGDLKISVGPFEIPEYLNRTQVVTRDGGTNIVVHKFDRWAEPLSESITRQVNFGLSNRITSGLVYQFPSIADIRPDYRVRGRISIFEANTNGMVTLQLRWGVLDKDNGFAIAPRGGNFSTPVESVADISEVTAAMGKLLDMLSQEIADELEAIGVQ
jgi:uncharacterized lipoprotein YmbA